MTAKKQTPQTTDAEQFNDTPAAEDVVLSPELFDIDNWITEAKLPEVSVPVFQRADLIAELSELERQYEVERAVAEAEPSLATKSASRVEAEYTRVLEQFQASRLVFYVRAIPSSLRDQLRKESDAADETSVEFGSRLLSHALVAVLTPQGVRHPIEMSLDQVRALESKVGPAQVKQLLNAYQSATNGLPEVDPGFLQRSSGQESTTD